MTNESTKGQVIQLARGNIVNRLRAKPLAKGELFIHTGEMLTLSSDTLLRDIGTNSILRTVFTGDIFAGSGNSKDVYCIGSGSSLKWGGVLFTGTDYATAVAKAKAYPNFMFLYNGDYVLYNGNDEGRTSQNAADASFSNSYQPATLDKQFVSDKSADIAEPINPGDLLFYNSAIDQVVVLHLGRTSDALTKVNVDALVSTAMQNLLFEDNGTKPATLKTFLDGPVRHYQYLVDDYGWKSVEISEPCNIRRVVGEPLSVTPGTIKLPANAVDGTIFYIPFTGTEVANNVYRFDMDVALVDEQLRTRDLREGDIIIALPADNGSVKYTVVSLYGSILDKFNLNFLGRADNYATAVWQNGIENSYAGDQEYFTANNSIQSFVDRLFKTKVDIDPLTGKIISSQLPDFLLGAPKYMGHSEFSQWHQLATDTSANSFAKILFGLSWEDLDNNEVGVFESQTIPCIARADAVSPYFTAGSKYYVEILNDDYVRVYDEFGKIVTNNGAPVSFKVNALEAVEAGIVCIASADEGTDQGVCLFDPIAQDQDSEDIREGLTKIYCTEVSEDANLTIGQAYYYSSSEQALYLDKAGEVLLYNTVPVDSTGSEKPNEIYLSFEDFSHAHFKTTNEIDDHDILNSKLKTGCYWIYTGDTVNVEAFADIFHLCENKDDMEGGEQKVEGEPAAHLLNKGDWIIYNEELSKFEIIDNSSSFVGLLVDGMKVTGVAHLASKPTEQLRVTSWNTNTALYNGTESTLEDIKITADSSTVTFSNANKVFAADEANLTSGNLLKVSNGDSSNNRALVNTRFSYVDYKTIKEAGIKGTFTDSSSTLFWQETTEALLEDLFAAADLEGYYVKNYASSLFVHQTPAMEFAIVNADGEITDTGFAFGNLESIDLGDTSKLRFKIAKEANVKVALPTHSGTLVTDEYVNRGFAVVQDVIDTTARELINLLGPNGNDDWLQTIKTGDDGVRKFLDSHIVQKATVDTFKLGMYYDQTDFESSSAETRKLASTLATYKDLSTVTGYNDYDVQLGEAGETGATTLNPSTVVEGTTVENVLPNHSGVLLNNNSVIDGGEW